jgi:parallel beta-helix repeat protein
MANDGSSGSPWSSLEAVFAAGKTFSGGDVIYLNNGDHGFPTISGSPAGDGQVLIQPGDGQSPTLKKVLFSSASKFTLKGVEVSPETETSLGQGPIITVEVSCSNIIITDCTVYSAKDTSSWTAEDWVAKAAHGIACEGVDSLVTKCHVYNVDNAVQLYFGGLNSVASHNKIEYFSGDAMRVLGDYQTLEYNHISNSIAVDSNHDDGIQSWSNGFNNPGSGTITGVTLRGNVILQYTETEHPLINRELFQGMALFGGFFKDFVIENNIVSIDHWNGISVYGAIDCLIINNTVMPNPIALSTKGPPRIHIRDHKTRGEASGNIIRNNLTSGINMANSSTAVVGLYEYNIVTSDVEAHFPGYENFDFHLSSDSSAINAGSTEDAPDIDIDGEVRDALPDVGADEVVSPVDAVTSLFPRAAKSAESWYRIRWAGSGWFNANYFPWIYHVQLGWWWCGSASVDNYWFYDKGIGWIYTDPGMPNIYFSAGMGVWLYASPESNDYNGERDFYNLSTRQWLKA